MLVLVYRKCSTCQKALRWLEEHKIFFEERAIVEENPTYEELKEWYGRSGMPLKKFFNTSGMLYKQMNLKDKLPEMTEDEQLKLLATDGMLVKRPLVVGEDFILTGFREKEWEEKYGVNHVPLKLETLLAGKTVDRTGWNIRKDGIQMISSIQSVRLQMISQCKRWLSGYWNKSRRWNTGSSATGTSGKSAGFHTTGDFSVLQSDHTQVYSKN